MKAFSSPFRSVAFLSAITALAASCSVIADFELDGKPFASSSSGGIGGFGASGMGGTGAGGNSAGAGGTGGSVACDGTCSADETCCAGGCFTLQTDVTHCGSCSNSCGTNEHCCNGSCKACCVDQDCPTADHKCNGGTCVLECTAPDVDCGTVCADLTTDSKHCGTCATDCLSGHACMDGKCVSGWAMMDETNALSARQRAAATWTGTHLFIWGGLNVQGVLNDGALYDPSTDKWTMLPAMNAPDARVDAVAIAVDNRVLVWGGAAAINGTGLRSGKLYDLGTSTWIDIPDAPIGRANPVAVWTNTKVLIWGGMSGMAPIAGGAFFDPVQKTWGVIANSNAPNSRSHAKGTWSGSELLIFGGRPGGTGATNDGFAYNPTTNTWRKWPTSMLTPSPRFDTFTAWTGNAMLVVGGQDGSNTFVDGGLYDPAANAWTATMTNPIGKRSAPTGRTGWASSGNGQIFTAGGLDETQALKNDCRVYDASVNDWGAQIPPWPSGADHEFGVGVWTGTEFILWSGLDNTVLTSAGDRFRP